MCWVAQFLEVRCLVFHTDAMKSLDPITPSDAEPGPVQAPLSLEQLLSLRPPVAPSVEAASLVVAELDSKLPQHGAAVPQVPLEVRRVSAMQGPVLLVVHGAQAGEHVLSAKLQGLSNEAQLQWMSLNEAGLDGLKIQPPKAALIQFTPSALKQATGIAQALQTQFPALPILAVGSMGDAESMLSALRIGVQDFLDIETSAEVLQRRLREILAQRVAAPRQETVDVNSQLTVFMAARAGVGCSLLATHLAQYLQQSLKADRRRNKSQDSEALHALLLDMGLPGNDNSLYLDLPVKFDCVQALQNLRRFDQKLASSGLMQHDSGLRVLPLSSAPISMQELGSLDLESLLPSLRPFFPYVVADLGGMTHPLLLSQVAKQATHIWVVCDQSLASVVATMELLQQLKTQQVPSSRMALIVSKYDAAIDLGAVQIAEQLQLPLLCKIPQRRTHLLQAVNQGQLIAREMWRDPYAQAIQNLVKQVLVTEVAPVPKPHYFGRLLQKLRR